nr:hypothetical protein [Komagataeibacter saccharivorans]
MSALEDLTEQPAEEVPPEGFAEIHAGRCPRPCCSTPSCRGTADGRGVLVDRNQQIVAAAPLMGVAESVAGRNAITPPAAPFRLWDRAQAKGHRGGVFWMTGLPGAGRARWPAQRKTGCSPAGSMFGCLMAIPLRAGLCSTLASPMRTA